VRELVLRGPETGDGQLVDAHCPRLERLTALNVCVLPGARAGDTAALPRLRELAVNGRVMWGDWLAKCLHLPCAGAPRCAAPNALGAPV